ncbi:FadR/GntR family transcriptional regulator [uncultured Pseudokineococcus sp.]|uniref:FadR/GntR family transcriptional regulator n=1 Tax=uncultured Pseudokineococcus sp. TaxID=1642928 RepID=UPI00260648DB|nr:GntR family transcriptional regulator [uncultured Pseudokineococcus sp.]
MGEGAGSRGRARSAPSTGPARLRRPRLYEQLADHITAFIEAQGLSPGERLPPERLLAEQLGVSRATLAQALVALEVRGVVDVRHGEGAVLREATAASELEAALASHGPDAEDLADARGAVLGALAALAAERADPEQRRVLAAALEPGSAAAGAPEAVAALVVEAAGSPTLARLARALEQGARGPLGPDPVEVARGVLTGDPEVARRATTAPSAAAREAGAAPAHGHA